MFKSRPMGRLGRWNETMDSGVKNSTGRSKTTKAARRRSSGENASSATDDSRIELERKFVAPQQPTVVAPPLSIPSPPLSTPQPSATPTVQTVAQDGPQQRPGPDFNRFATNLTQLMNESTRAAAAYAEGAKNARLDTGATDTIGDVTRTLGAVAEYWLADPQRAMQAQAGIAGNFIELWSRTMHRLSGEAAAPVVPADPADKRFTDPQWQENPIFDFLRQAYSLTTNWADDLVKKAESVDPATRERAQFYLRQIAGAVSPSNFLPTNPELLRETIRENGANLVRGMQMLATDLEAGKGQLRIRQADDRTFTLGVNMAASPGKVVFRNELLELIQYSPTTAEVYKRPLLIIPPWINKFYILDLNPQKSFVRWAVAQGLTVFVVSWVNPDERQAEKGFDAYVKEGVLAALDAIGEATGEKDVSVIGYCVGGTLLSAALAWMAATGDDRISSATLFTTQVDFTDAGDLKHFVDEARVRAIEASMEDTGYLEGGQMAGAFNMLRPNDLIWSYVVNNYLKGKEPPAFDLLVWNSDSTRMPKANHSFYLRNCYLENNLTKGRMTLLGQRLDLRRVTIPIYNLAAREDHIAPARSVFAGAKFFGGEMRYVLAGSGHIAGVVNPAESQKYQYWTGGPVKGSFDEWLAGATETPGSWWPDWLAWLIAQAPQKVPARHPGDGKLTPLCDAPGEYVRVKS